MSLSLRWEELSWVPLTASYYCDFIICLSCLSVLKHTDGQFFLLSIDRAMLENEFANQIVFHLSYKNIIAGEGYAPMRLAVRSR